jgi:hypothetical protein
MIKLIQIAILLIALGYLHGCGNIPQDQAKSSIDANYYRVETEVCGRYDIGLNGCALVDGVIGDNVLKVMAPLKGTIQLSSKCLQNDVVINYNKGNNIAWEVISLKDIFGEKITKDCVITIYQALTFPNQDKLTFPVRGIIGKVVLFSYPENVKYVYDNSQTKIGNSAPTVSLFGTEVGAGKYKIAGCDQDLTPVIDFTSPISFNPDNFFTPQKSCLYFYAVRKLEERFKGAFDINYYANDYLELAYPSTLDGQFEGDKNAAISFVDFGKVIVGNTGKLTNGSHVLRFYTSQGRTLVAKMNNGEILWVK